MAFERMLGGSGNVENLSVGAVCIDKPSNHCCQSTNIATHVVLHGQAVTSPNSQCCGAPYASVGRARINVAHG